MFDTWQRARNETPELNLIPVMNLMVVLIPLLLLGAAFFHISVIPTSIASDSTGSAEPSPEVTMKIEISREALELSGHSGDPEVDPATLAASFPVSEGRYDLGALQKKLIEIKTAHPTSEKIVLAAYDELPYLTLIRIVDTAREKLDVAQSGAEPKREPLFPLTVFAKPRPKPQPIPEVVVP